MQAGRPELEQLANAADFDERTLHGLLRALNTRRTVAFLGSGASIPYGATTWDDMIAHVGATAHGELKRLLDLETDKGVQAIRPQVREKLKRLKLTLSNFETVSSEGAKAAGAAPAPSRSEAKLAQLELYQLALDLAAQAFSDMQSVPALRGEPKPPRFHDLIGEMFRGDLFPAKDKAVKRLNALAAGLSGYAVGEIPPGETDPAQASEPRARFARVHTWLKPYAEPLAFTSRRRFHFQQLYSIETLKRLEKRCAELGKRGDRAVSILREARKALAADAAQARKNPEDNGLPPDRRSYFSLVFAALIAELARSGATGPKAGRLVLSGLDDALGGDDVEPLETGASPRRLAPVYDRDTTPKQGDEDFEAGEMTFQELRPRTDLVERVVQGLHFGRILTTNYDDEVERYLERMNYPRGTLSARKYMNQTFSEQVDPETGRRASRSFLGRAAASDVLTKDSVTQLIDLATRSHDAGAQVLHLHGRADRPDTIIATESDYQRLYMNNSRHRRSFENALHIVFSGNPILFIGSGLQEQDLQRPLREFVSNRRGEDRDLFALLPALHREDSLQWSKIENYLRYGVRVMFYGERNRQRKLSKQVTKAVKGEQSSSADIDYQALQLAPLNKSIGEHIDATNALIEMLNQAVNAIGEHLAQGAGGGLNRAPSVIKALEKLHAEFGDKKGAPQAIRKLCSETIVENFFAPDREIQEDATAALKHCVAKARRKLDKVIENGRPDETLKRQLITLSAALELYAGYVTSLQSDLISATLDQALEQLRSLRGRWWRDSQGAANRREAHLFDSGPATPRVNYRHPVVWPYDGPDTECREADALAEQLLDHRCKSAGALVVVRGRSGDGKGGFYRSLTRSLIANGREGAKYDFAWYSNVSHSLEFSAILTQIADFVAHVTAEALTGASKDRLDELNAFAARNGRIALIDRCIDEIMSHIQADPAAPLELPRAVIVICGFDAFFAARGNALTVELEQFCRLLGRIGATGGVFDVVIVATDETRITDALSAAWQVPPVRTGACAPVHPTVEVLAAETFEAGLQVLKNSLTASTPPPGAGVRTQHLVAMPLPDDTSDTAQVAGPATDAQNALSRLLSGYGISKRSYVASLLRKTLAEKTIWAPQAQGGKTPDFKEIDDLKTDWVKQIESSLVRTAPESHRFRIFDRVLTQYGMRTDDPSGRLDTDSRIDFLVMKTIAFFGCPIEGAVLLRAHELRKYLRDRAREELVGRETQATDRSVLQEMVTALELSLKRLLSRGLLGAIAYDDGSRAHAALGSVLNPEEYGPREEPAADKIAKLSSGARFILHPKMKHFIASQYAYRAPDQGFTNTFVLTMYAAQPIDVALMNPDVQHTVDNLIDDLVQAWRVIPIASVEELVTPPRRTGDLVKPPVEGWQRVLLEHVALGLADEGERERALDEACRGDAEARTKADEAWKRIESEFGRENLFRAKTFRGLLARGSADMSACFRGAYSVVRQLRPFSVLARMDQADPADADQGAAPPFDLIALRLRHLMQGMNSAEQAHSLAQAVAEDPENEASLDEKLAPSGLEPHPINTFGPAGHRKRALYSHELAWLWNERGVIALAQGKLYDALPFFNEAARVIAEHDGSDSALSSGAARIKVNIAAAWIERGSLRRAEEILYTVLRSCGEQRLPGLGDPPWDDDGAATRPVAPGHPVRQFVRPVAIGYLGLIHHLKGNLNLAVDHYSRAVAALEPQQQNRAISIFSKHWADALAALNEPGGEMKIRSAISSAQSMMQIDQLHYCYLSQARQKLQDGCGPEDQAEARKLIASVEAYALKMGLPRLSCEALFFDAKLKGLQGQLGPALQSASEAVAIAAKHGMKVRRISCSIQLGELIWKNGDRKTGRRLLEEAGEAAQRIGYQLAVERQQKAIHTLSR